MWSGVLAPGRCLEDSSAVVEKGTLFCSPNINSRMIGVYIYLARERCTRGSAVSHLRGDGMIVTSDPNGRLCKVGLKHELRYTYTAGMITVTGNVT